MRCWQPKELWSLYMDLMRRGMPRHPTVGFTDGHPHFDLSCPLEPHQAEALLTMHALDWYVGLGIEWEVRRNQGGWHCNAAPSEASALDAILSATRYLKMSAETPV